jgi:hypothetical protein
MVIARLDAETVAAIEDAKRAIAAEHAALLRSAQDAQASAEVRATDVLMVSIIRTVMAKHSLASEGVSGDRMYGCRAPRFVAYADSLLAE